MVRTGKKPTGNALRTETFKPMSILWDDATDETAFAEFQDR
jgi:hypothetical protein